MEFLSVCLPNIGEEGYAPHLARKNLGLEVGTLQIAINGVPACSLFSFFVALSLSLPLCLALVFASMQWLITGILFYCVRKCQPLATKNNEEFVQSLASDTYLLRALACTLERIGNLLLWECGKAL